MNTPILQAQNLTKRYGALTAVQDLTLEVCQGEIFGFLGPNGAGKTTSINMICGLLKPDRGQVRIAGQPLQPGDRRVGVCPQNIVLWERLTCLEQLTFIGQMYDLPARQARQRSEYLLEALDLTEKRRALASALSGGMQRRLNLAMALVHDPQIVVLDEPEAGLDPQSRIKVREFIRDLARSTAGGLPRTVILTTHNMDEADRLVDRLAIIDHGQLLVLDTPAALKHRLGAGDVIELHLNNGQHTEPEVQAVLHGLASDVRLEPASQTLRIRALNAVGQLPDLLQALQAAGYNPGEISIRANTLEDVFIDLTGRKLRE